MEPAIVSSCPSFASFTNQAGFRWYFIVGCIFNGFYWKLLCAEADYRKVGYQCIERSQFLPQFATDRPCSHVGGACPSSPGPSQS